MLNVYMRSYIQACGWLRRSDYLLHQPCYAMIEGVQIVGPRMIDFELKLRNFLLVGGTGVPKESTAKCNTRCIQIQ